MEKHNPLLPLAFDISKESDPNIPLSTLPRAREERDENAGGTIFHTRGADIKRKIEQSPQQHESRKSRKYDTSDMINSDDFLMGDADRFPGTSTQKHLMSSFLSSDFNNYPSSESLIHNGRMPSSPPMQAFLDDTDNDFNPLADKTFILPSSPQNVEEQFQTPTYPPSQLNLQKQSQQSSNMFFNSRKLDEFDFGIDRFNRVQGVHSDQPSSELGNEDIIQGSQQQQESGNSSDKAREIISKCFEDQITDVHLDNLELTTIPEEIEDFKDLVTFDNDGSITKPRIQLYIAHNKIKTITPRLFELGDLIEVLSLRSNKIKVIPGAIGNLRNLNYLNASSNSIQTLPHQILKLANLQKLLLRPNKLLLEKDDFNNVVDIHEEMKNNKTKKFIGRLKYINRHEHAINPLSIKMTRNFSILSQASESEFFQQLPQRQSFDTFDEEEQLLLKNNLSSVPRLSELCLRKFSSYKTSKSETKKWSRSVGLSTSKLVAKAFHQGAYGEKCSSCDETVIQYVAEVLEWWDILDTKLVPIRKQFCCGRCVKVWELQNKH